MTDQNHIDVKTCDYQNEKVAMNIYQNFPYNDHSSNPAAEFGSMVGSLVNIGELVGEESVDGLVCTLHDGSRGQSSSCNLEVEERSQSEEEETCYHRMTPRGLSPVKEGKLVENTINEKTEQCPNVENEPFVQRDSIAAVDANCVGSREDNELCSQNDPMEEIAAYVQQSKAVPGQQSRKGNLKENQAEEINVYVRQSELPLYLSKTDMYKQSNVQDVNSHMCKNYDENKNDSVRNQPGNQLGNVSGPNSSSEDISVTCPLTSQTDIESEDADLPNTNAYLDRPVTSPHLDRPVASSHLDSLVTSPEEGEKLKSSSADSDEGISHDPHEADILIPSDSDENQNVSLEEEDLFQTKMDSTNKTSTKTGIDVDTNRFETVATKNGKNHESSKTNCHSDVESMFDSTTGGDESDHHYLKHNTLNLSAFLHRKGSDDGYISNGNGSPLTVHSWQN